MIGPVDFGNLPESVDYLLTGKDGLIRGAVFKVTLGKDGVTELQ